MFFPFLLVGAFLFVNNCHYDEIHIEEFKLNGIYNERQYKQLVNESLDENIQRVVLSFENFFVLSENDNLLKSENILKIIKFKTFEFNKINAWNVEMKDGVSQETFTTMIFHFNGESCTLNLTREEAQTFLNENILTDFVIPGDMSITMDPSNNDEYLVNYDIMPEYISINELKKGYHKNIYQIFGLLKGLFMISMKCDKYVHKRQLKKKEDFPNLSEKYREILDNYKHFKFPDQTYSQVVEDQASLDQIEEKLINNPINPNLEMLDDVIKHVFITVMKFSIYGKFAYLFENIKISEINDGIMSVSDEKIGEERDGVRRIKTTNHPKDFYHDYLLKASQQIAGMIYFHYFAGFIKDKKILLSDNLKNIFFVFDQSDEEGVADIIKSNFSHIANDEKTFHENMSNFLTILMIIKQLQHISVMDIKATYFNGGFEKVSQKYRLDKYKEVSKELEKAINDFPLSPMMFQKIVGTAAYLNPVMENQSFEEHFKAEAERAKLFNSEVFKQDKASGGFVPELSLDEFEFYGIDHTAKENPSTDQYEMDMTTHDFKKKYKKKIFSKFRVFEFYKFLRKIIQCLKDAEKTNNEMEFAELFGQFIQKFGFIIDLNRRKNEYFLNSQDGNACQRLLIHLTSKKGLDMVFIDEKQALNDLENFILNENGESRIFYSLVNKCYVIILKKIMRESPSGTLGSKVVNMISHNFETSIKSFEYSKLNLDKKLVERRKYFHLEKS